MSSRPFNPDALRRLVVDTTANVILALDTEHRIVEWNHAAEELFQTPRERALGLDYVQTFLAPEFREPVAADIRKVLAGVPTRNFEDDQILPDGTRRTLIWNVDRLLDADGAPVGIVAVGQDITDRKRAEEMLRLVFEQSTEGLLLGGPGGVIDCNPAALAMLGLTDKAQLVGRHPAEYAPPTQPDGTPSRQKARELDAASREQPESRFEFVHRHADGSDLPVEVRVRRARLGDRTISVVAWHDLRERRAREAERELLQRRLADAQKMEAVGQLAGGIAHDFNNLLTAIRGSLELARMELGAGDAARRELETASRATDRAAQLTRQLLAFSRQQHVAPQAVDLGALARNLTPMLQSLLPPTVVLDVHGEPAVVRADAGQLEQVILNLVLNARDAMPTGGTLDVEVRTLTDPDVVRLTVRDSGTGMDAETLGRAFEPFFTTKPIGQGTGLGLAVVYGIVTHWGGTVRVTSEVGEGSAFLVDLPPSAEQPAAGGRRVAEAPPRGTETILLVEDEAQVRSTTRRLLERFGYAVIEARHGVDALEIWRDRRDGIAAVLSDVRMPAMSGPDLARRLRAEAPTLPILFVSGYDRLEAGDPTGEWPADIPLIQKPFEAEQLLRELRSVLDVATGGG